MRVPVKGIPASGRLVEFGMHTDWAVAAASEALDGPVDALSGSLTLTPASDRGLVEVRGPVEAHRQAACDRCGDPCERLVSIDVSLLYAPEARDDDTFDGGELELSAADLDLGWYGGRALELAAVVGEALALEVSPRIRCTDVEECDRRTADLLATAGSAGEPGHPALAALRDKLA